MKLIKKFLEVFIYLLAAFFLGKILFSNWSKIELYLDTANLYLLTASLIITTLAITLQSFTWHRLINSIVKVRFGIVFSGYFKSLITRYLPGGIWVYLARTYTTVKLGIPKAQALYLIALENLIMILSGGIIYLIIRPSTNLSLILALLITILNLTIISLLISPTYFLRIYKILFKKELALVPIHVSTIIQVGLLYLLQWLLLGLGAYLLITSFQPISINFFLPVTALFVISWMIGFLILIVPSGLGVRESVLVVLLTPLLGVQLAVMAALFSRLSCILGELINFLFSFVSIDETSDGRKS